MARWGMKNGTICPEHVPAATPDGSPKPHRKRRKPCKAVVRAMLDGCAPHAADVRGLLSVLEAQTGLPRPLRARLLGVPLHSLRRWEDNTRKPDQAARRLIALTCAAIAGLGPFEIIKVMSQQASTVTADRSRTAGERLAALRSIPQLGFAEAELCGKVMKLARANEAAEECSA